MEKNLDIHQKQEYIRKATRYIYALHGLLETLEESHFDANLDGARKEAGTEDPKEGSFWWMQTHYNSASAAVLAANCLAATLEEILIILDDSFSADEQELVERGEIEYA